MRVLVLSPGFPTYDGPFTPGVVDTLEALSQRGHRLVVHSIRPPPPEAGLHHHRGIEVVAHGGGSKPRRIVSLIRAIADAERPDLIWALWVNKTGLLGAALGTVLGRPLIASLMGGELADFPELHYGSWAAERRGISVALAAAQRITVGSEPLFERLGAVLPSARSKALIAPLGVPPAPRERVAVPADRDRGRLRVVSVSSNAPIKRIDIALEAFEIIQREHPGVTLDIFGAETEQGRPIDGVGWMGFIPPQDLRPRLADYDLLLHASAHEAQGLALIEAALARLPIASLEVGVAGELRRLGASIALATAPGSAIDLARAAAEALRLGSLDPAPITARFGLSAAADRFDRLFAEVVG